MDYLNQEFSQRRGPQRKLLHVPPIYVMSPTCFSPKPRGNGNDDIPSEEHSENLKSGKGSYFDL